MARRHASGSRLKCRRSEALYIMTRRLMNTAVSTTSSAGVSEASSCAAATIEAPANTTIDISIATGGVMPLATMATPVMMPKATTPGSAASAARAPARRSLLAAVFADAGLQLFAALVLAGLAQLLAARHALLVERFALRRILRLRAHLLHDAVLVFGAFLAFAGRGLVAVRILCFGGALFAGFWFFLLFVLRIHHAHFTLSVLV